jgi:hypothetical protein
VVVDAGCGDIEDPPESVEKAALEILRYEPRLSTD